MPETATKLVLLACASVFVGLGLEAEALAGGPGVLEGRPVVGRPPPWIRRHLVDSTLEFGALVGTLGLPDDHPFFARGLEPGARFGPWFAAHLGYYRWRWLGFEAELGVAPTSLRDAAGWPALISSRGHLVARLAINYVVPYLLVGGGALVAGPSAQLQGSPALPVLDFGGGLELVLDRGYPPLVLRLDARDALTWARTGDQLTPVHGLQLSLGVGLSFSIHP